MESLYHLERYWNFNFCEKGVYFIWIKILLKLRSNICLWTSNNHKILPYEHLVTCWHSDASVFLVECFVSISHKILCSLETGGCFSQYNCIATKLRKYNNHNMIKMLNRDNIFCRRSPCRLCGHSAWRHF